MSETSATPALAPAKTPTPEEKAGLLMAVSQLEMLVSAFQNAPERVRTASVELRDALQEWADGGAK